MAEATSAGPAPGTSYPEEFLVRLGDATFTPGDYPNALAEHGPHAVMLVRDSGQLQALVVTSAIIKMGVLGRSVKVLPSARVAAMLAPEDCELFAGREEVLVCAPPLEGPLALALAQVAMNEEAFIQSRLTTLMALDSVAAVASGRVASTVTDVCRYLTAATADFERRVSEVEPPVGEWNIYVSGQGVPPPDRLTAAIKGFASHSTRVFPPLPPFDAGEASALIRFHDILALNGLTAEARTVITAALNSPLFVPLCRQGDLFAQDRSPRLCVSWSQFGPTLLRYLFSEELTHAARRDTAPSAVTLAAPFVLTLGQLIAMGVRHLPDSVDRAFERLNTFVGGYLADLDLSRTFITGSAIAAAAIVTDIERRWFRGEEVSFPCEKCGELFDSRQRLDSHLRVSVVRLRANGDRRIAYGGCFAGAPKVIAEMAQTWAADARSPGSAEEGSDHNEEVTEARAAGRPSHHWAATAEMGEEIANTPPPVPVHPRSLASLFWDIRQVLSRDETRGAAGPSADTAGGAPADTAGGTPADEAAAGEDSAAVAREAAAAAERAARADIGYVNYLAAHYPPLRTIPRDRGEYEAIAEAARYSFGTELSYDLARDPESKGLTLLLRCREPPRGGQGEPTVRTAVLDVKTGSDVDMAIDVETNDEFDRVAHGHFAAVRARYPKARLVKVPRDDPADPRYNWAISCEEDPNFRQVEMYRASFNHIVTHHVGMVSGAYTAAFSPGKPQFVVSSRFALAADDLATPNYYYFASRKTPPQFIVKKFEMRGFRLDAFPPGIRKAIAITFATDPDWSNNGSLEYPALSAKGFFSAYSLPNERWALKGGC
jgi:hypothetical protein